MQKKVLASLLVTPMAFNAFANITVNPNLAETNEGWSQTGISGQNPFEGEGKITCPIGSGVLTKSLGTLNPGKYIVTIATPKNVLAKVAIASEPNVPVVDPVVDGNVQFEVKVKGEYILTITGNAQDKEFSLEKISLEIDFDYEAVQGELNKVLGTVEGIESVNADDKSDLATALRKEETTLKEALEAIKDEINGLESLDIDGYNEYYKTYGKDPENAIKDKIEDLAKKIVDYNKRVIDENNLYTTITNNEAARDAYLQDVKDLQAKLDGEKAKVAEDETYVINSTTDEFNAAQEAINTWETDIKEAYASDKLNEPIKLDSQVAEIEEKIKAYANAVTTAKADWAAYQDVMPAQINLATVTNAAQDALDEIKGTAPMATDFNNYVAGQLAKVNETYATALDKIFGKSKQDPTVADILAGYNNNLTNDLKTLDDAAAAINGIVETTKASKETYDGIVAKINDYKTKFEEIVNSKATTAIVNNLPNTEKAKYDNLKNAAENDINTLISTVDKDWDADLTEMDTAAVSSKTALENYLSAWEPVTNLYVAFDDLKKFIENQADTDIEPEEFNLLKKFKGALESIQQGIEDIYTDKQPADFDQEDIKNVAGAIAKQHKYAADVMGAYITVSKDVKDFQAKLDELKGYVDTKKYLEGNKWDKNAFLNAKDSDYKKLADELSDFQTRLGDLDNLEAQKCYEAATQLDKDVKASKYAEGITNATKTFEADATDGNYNAVDDALTALNNYIADGEYYGQNSKDITDAVKSITDQLGEIKTVLEEAKNAAEPVIDTFNGIDDSLEALLKEINDENSVVKALKDNQQAYDDILAAGWPYFELALEDLIQHNEDTSMSPAEEFYFKVINGPENEESIAVQIYNLKSEIDKALAEQTAVKDKDALIKKISDMKKVIDDLKAAITNNQAAFTTETNESARVRTVIQGIIDDINEYVDASAKELVADWISDLEELRDKDLTANDLLVNKNYGVGKSYTEKQTLMDEYTRIENAAKAIQTAFTDTFKDRVKDANDKVVIDAKWTVEIEKMNDAYRNAIRTYNAFFALENDNYRAFILPIVQTHQPIYQFSEKITTLQSTVAQAVNDQSAAGKVYSLEEFEAIANAEALKIITDINAEENAMLSHCNSEAEKYYDGTAESEGISQPEAAKLITDATEEMAAAGILSNFVENSLKGANILLHQAEKAYNVEHTGKFCLTPMDGIANDLDAIPASIDVNEAAHNQWDAEYAVASEDLSTLREQLVNITDTETQNLVDDFDTKVDEAKALNTTASNDTKLIDNLKADKAELDAIVAGAKDIVDKQQAKVDADNANTALSEEFAQAATTLDTDFAALQQFVDALAGEISLGAIQQKIDDFNQAREAHKTSLVANEGDIRGLLTQAQNAIKAGYKSEKDAEATALASLLHKTQVAFNNAKTYESTLENLDGINTQIDQLAAQIEALNGPDYNNLPENKDQYQQTALQVEKQLSDLYVKLEGSYSNTDLGLGGNPVPGIIAELEKQYTELAGEIETATSEYDGYLQSVKDAYPDAYSNITEALDKVKADWEADENKVVVTAENYKAEMQALQSKFNDLKAKIEAKQAAAQAEADRVAANQTAYDTLSSELTGLQTKADELKTLAESYGVELQYSYLDYLLQDAGTRLKSEFDSCELTAESELPRGTEIKSQIVLLTRQAEETHYNNILNAANTAYSDALKALGVHGTNSYVVPEIKAEQEEKLNGVNSTISNLEVQKTTIREELNKGNITIEQYYEQLHTIEAELEKATETAESIKTVADENVFTPGNLDGDANGEVNTVDLQILVGWVGQGMTYQELYNENPVLAAAADLYGDKELNVADITGLIQLIMNDAEGIDATKVARKVAPAGFHHGENIMSLARLSSENGVREYTLNLNNGDTFIAGQFDIKLPSGMTLTDVKLEGRAAGHEIQMFENGNGSYRIVIFSMNNEVIEGNSGALVRLITEGIGTPEVTEGVFADSYNEPVKVTSAETSAIESIHNGAVNVKDRIYDAAGRAYNKLQRGINIIRHADGTTTKEIHK